MISFTISAPVRKLTDRYKDLFLPNDWSKLASMFAYFLSGSDSLSDFARKNPWSPSVSSLSRFVIDFNGDRLMRRMRKSALRSYVKKYGSLDPKNFAFAVDDTNNPKFGKSYRDGAWYSSKGITIGQRIIVLALVDFRNDFAIPLSYRVGTKTDHPEYQPCYEFVIEILKELKADGFPTLPVVFDSWFDSSEFIEDVRVLGFDATWELKSSRTVRTSISPWSHWKKIGKAFVRIRRLRLRNRMESHAIRNRTRRGPCGSQLQVWIKGIRKSKDLAT